MVIFIHEELKLNILIHIGKSFKISLSKNSSSLFKHNINIISELWTFVKTNLLNMRM